MCAIMPLHEHTNMIIVANSGSIMKTVKIGLIGKSPAIK